MVIHQHLPAHRVRRTYLISKLPMLLILILQKFQLFPSYINLKCKVWFLSLWSQNPLSSKGVSWVWKVAKHPQIDVPDTLLMQTDVVSLISPTLLQFSAEKTRYKVCYIGYSLQWFDWFLSMLLELVRKNINNLTHRIKINGILQSWIYLTELL